MADRPTSMPAAGDDDKIVEYCNRTIWDAYHQLRQPWLRQIEANVRALAGRQYDEWVPEMGQFVDLAEVFAAPEDRWRDKPVFNWLGQHWFMVTLAKLTENTPSLGCLPATSEQSDAMTAALFDPFFRYYWGKLGMPELQYPHYGWVLTAGESIIKSSWDPDAGEPYEYAANLPVAPDGQPKAPGPQPPLLTKTGDLDARVMCPAAVLFPYGPWPHWKAPWVMEEELWPVEEVNARWGVRLEPDPTETRNDLLLRLQYTSFYGNTGSPGGGWNSGWGMNVAVKDLIRVRRRWQRATPEFPYGRLTTVTKTACLSDEINPYVIPGVREKVVIPFARFPRPGYPFRQEGHTDLENLLPLARARNRALAGGGDYVERNEQPAKFYNRNLVPDDQVEHLNRPGANIGVDGDPNRVAAYLNVPQLPMAGQEWAALLREEMELMGHADKSAGTVPNDARSGELLQQDRFNTDRPWGATLRLHSHEWARMAEQWMDITAACMEDQRVLAIAGTDQVMNFITVRPELMQGRINVYPLPGAAVMETPDAKQQRLGNTLTIASQLMTVNPQWADTFLQEAGYPDLQRFRPGGQAVELAQRQIAEMVQTGILAPIFPEQDHAAHVAVVTTYMQGLAYRNLPDQLKVVLRVYKQLHELAGQKQLIQQVTDQSQTAEAAAEASGMPSPADVAHQQVAPPEGKPQLKRVK